MPEPTLPTAPTALPTQQDILQTPVAPPAESEPATSIPDEVLQIPIVYGLLHGAPPAVYAPKDRQEPEIQAVVKNQKQLVAAGFGFYPSKDGVNTVFYNSTYVSPESLKKADAEGKLTEIVPSFDELKKKFDSALSGTPAESALPGAPLTPAAGGAPPSSRTQNTLASARVKNLQVGSPTSGPVPGGGRILSNILKPTI